MTNVGDQKKCESCQKLFETQQGLDKHQSNPKNYGCHRLHTLNNRDVIQNEVNDRKVNVQNVCLKKHHVNVSMGIHPMRSPIQAKKKRCILNLYQSVLDDGKTIKEAKHETATRLGFGELTVANTVKEMIANGYVQDNKYMRRTGNAFGKLAEEEIDDI